MSRFRGSLHRRVPVAVCTALALGASVQLATAPSEGAPSRYVKISSPKAGQRVGSTVTVRGTARPTTASVVVGYGNPSGGPSLGVTSARHGRWRLRVSLPRGARQIFALSASGGQDTVRVKRR